MGIEYDYGEQDTKKECPIADSELCSWAGKKGCENCYVRTLRDSDDKERALKNWQIMLSNIPENIDSLHESETCVLCKDEPRKTDCYASIDLAHPEPKAMKGMFFGFGKKIRVPVGSLVTVNMAACSRCRKTHFMVDFVFWGTMIGMIALAFILVSIPAIANPLVAVSALVPIVVVAALGIAGYFGGKALSKRYRTRASSTVHMDLVEVPLIREMFDRGWFYFQDSKDQPKLFFKSKKTFGRIFSKKNDLEANVENQS